MNTICNSTLKTFANYLKLKNYSDKTILCYTNCLRIFIQSLGKSALHVSSNDYNKFMLEYKFTSRQQQNQYISAIKIFYEKILCRKFIRADFSRPRGEKTLPKIIDSETLISRITEIKNTKHRAIISLAYSVGLRVSEVINLKISDIDSKRMVINIINGKGRKDRIVPLSNKILVLLREYFIEYRPILYLFNGQNNIQRYSAVSCNAIVKRYIGPEFHFHMLRHSCFTHLIENGTDCRVIQKLAGHSNIKTTEGYMQVSTRVLSKINLPI